MKKPIFHAILITTLITACSYTIAATATSTMTNTVTITNVCTISTAGFTTTYDPISTNASSAQNTTATVTTTCTIGAVPVVTLGQGANADTGSTDAVPLRRLQNPVATVAYLNYGLFSDSNRTVTWGNTAGTAPSGVTANGTPTALTVYAQIPGGQSVKAGTYTDNVVATVTY